MVTRSPVAPIDAHTHLFPEEFIRQRERLLERDPWFGQAFGTPKARMVGEEALLASMTRAEYACSVVAGWPWRDPGLCREHNAYLANVARRHPGRIAWLGIVNPVLADVDREIERCIAEGAAGFGELNADAQGFDWAAPGDIAHAFDAFRQLDVPVMIHASEPVGHTYPGKGTATPDRLVIALAAFPEVRFVAAHWGGGLPFYELMPEVRELARNVVYDSAASTFLYDFSVFPVVLRIVGAGRILFGSDYPVLGQRRFLSRVLAAGLPVDALRDILAGNACRVYRLKARGVSR
mgnify:CR=1 FL=1